MLVCRADDDESSQATVDWSWGTVRYHYRLSNSDDDDADDEQQQQQHSSDMVSSPQQSDVQLPSSSSPPPPADTAPPLQVTLAIELHQSLTAD